RIEGPDEDLPDGAARLLDAAIRRYAEGQIAVERDGLTGHGIDRAAVSSGEHTRRRQPKTAVAGITDTAGGTDGEHTVAIDCHIELVVSGLQTAGRKIRPLFLDDGQLGDFIAVSRFRLGARVDAVEFAITFITAGFDVGEIVGEKVERLHAGTHAAGGRNRNSIHAARRCICAAKNLFSLNRSKAWRT